jgi:hemerythrin
MSIIKWRDSYNTDVKQFDDEHHRIVELIDTMFVALRDKSGKEVFVKVCDELLLYTGYHFENEEKAMETAKYPYIEAHIAEHIRLKKMVQKFQAIINSEFPEGSSELYRFLREWLFAHIQNVDKKYSPYLKAKAD